MEYVNAFLCGGLLCLIGQILIDKTKPKIASAS
ncbi:MAG: SpoVA/SpoVAEb family sporulation membrane protein [Oscillospiraceae bacterium]|nr:SpoVA/SpoVAEb family sporulation membrane protein [Oscillospiraceae bacterium]